VVRQPHLLVRSKVTMVTQMTMFQPSAQNFSGPSSKIFFPAFRIDGGYRHHRHLDFLGLTAETSSFGSPSSLLSSRTRRVPVLI
jgi:hypothetical protein